MQELDHHYRIYWQKGSFKSCDFSQLDIHDQLKLMNATIKSEWSGPASYDLLFIKKVLQDLEGKEIYEDWYTRYTEIMHATSGNDLIYRHYCLPIASKNEPFIKPAITVAENAENIYQGQTGLRTWGASLEAINYFSHNPQLIQEKAIGELGAGCGLLGLFIKLLGAKQVVMSDVEELIDRLNINVSLNREKLGHLDIVKLDWENFQSLPWQFQK